MRSVILSGAHMIARRAMRNRPALTLLAVAVPLLGGCSARSSLDRLNDAPAQEFRGHYTRSVEGSWFRPCDAAVADSVWWVTITGTAVSQLDGARNGGQFVEGRPSFVQWRAVLTRGGEVGPPGATALLVRDILVIRPAASGDCAAP
jgi:hypothetical protein